MEKVGVVTHFYQKLLVAVVELCGNLSIRDNIIIKGKNTHLEMYVSSIQVDHENIEKAEKGQEIGLRVMDVVRPNDVVYRK